MYDINFVLPISVSKDIYSQRLIDFKKFGILNIKDKKVLVTLLKGTETISDFDIGWKENVTVEIISSEYNDVTLLDFFQLKIRSNRCSLEEEQRT